MAGQRVVKRAHSNCEDEAIKENPVKRFFAKKIAVNATGWIDPLKDHLSRRRISSSCRMYISTFYKIISASGNLQIKDFWVLDFLPFFVRDFQFPISPDCEVNFSSMHRDSGTGGYKWRLLEAKQTWTWSSIKQSSRRGKNKTDKETVIWKGKAAK